MPKARKARSQRSATIAYQTYVFRIVDWELSYSFALNAAPRKEAPYWEHVALNLSAECLSPSKLKGRICPCTVFGSRREARDLEEPPEPDWKPLRVGTLTIRGEKLDYFGSLPQDSLWGLVSALQTDKLRVLDLHGEVLRRGKAPIRSIGFSREVDPDELE